jgi:HEAT repeat protein
VPEFVQDELGQRAGLDLQKLQEARVRERVAHYTEQLKARDPRDREIAAQLLGEIGPPAEAAVPALVEALQEKDPDVRAMAAEARADIRIRAAEALGRIGPAAAAAVPALGEALVQDEVVQGQEGSLQWEAAWALGQIGAPAVPTLVEVLQDGRARQLRLAAMAVGQIGPAAARAVSALVWVLRREDWDVEGEEEWRGRVHAAEALGQIGPAAASAVPALAEVVQDEDGEEDETVYLEAVAALGRIGPAAAAAVPALTKALQHPQTEASRVANHKRHAAAALGRIGPAAVPALIESLQQDVKIPLVRTEAARALGQIGPAAKAAVPALSEALQDEDPKLRAAATEALGQIGPQAQTAAPTLVDNASALQ